MRKLCASMAALVLFGSGAIANKVVFSDLFVFRMDNSVYSLDTLQTYHSFLKDFKCFYPESIVVAAFSELLNIEKDYFDISHFKTETHNSHHQLVTQKFITVLKLNKYASLQGVSVSSSLPNAMKLSAKKNKCSLNGFSAKGFKKELADIVLLEVFLRSRFMPKTGEKLTSDQAKSVLKNISSLAESVRSQVDHELFDN